MGEGMDWENITSQYPPGTRVMTTVEKIDYYGVFTSLPEGISGYVRRGEALLTRKITDLHNVFTVGQQKEAVVVRANPRYHSLELSFRQAEQDPWDTLQDQYPIGSTVEGEVVLLTESKAWLEIRPGMMGLIPKSEIWLQTQRIEEIFMIQDTVRAQVIDVDEKGRFLVLSIRELYKEEFEDSTPGATFRIGDSLSEALEIFQWEQTRQTFQDLGFSERTREKYQDIILLESNSDISLPFSLMLDGFGFRTQLTQHQDSFFTDLERGEFQLLLTNPEALSGILSAASHDQLQRLQQIDLILYCTINQCEAAQRLLTQNTLSGAIQKIPYRTEELVTTMNQLANGQIGSGLSRRSLLMPHRLAKSEQERVAREFDSNLAELLQQMKESCQADFAMIFEMNLNSREVAIYTEAGRKVELTDFEKSHLQFSPIRDVIIDKAIIAEPEKGQQYKYMHCLGSFHAVVGRRINYQDENGYAFFLFSEQSYRFSQIPEQYFDVYEIALNALIAKEKFWSKRKEEQKFILIGKLTSTLVHEIQNQITAMGQWIVTLKADSVSLNKDRFKSDDRIFRARFEKAVNGLLELHNKSLGIDEIFLNLLRKDKEQEINICDYIMRTLSALKPLADRRAVLIETEMCRDFLVRIDTPSLNQILINLFMNSLDFIATVRKKSGRIKIKVEKSSQRPGFFDITYWDNGPGVNEKKRERIFDMLYSTKPGGSGLGLYISRTLAQSMGGSIRVLKTVRLSELSFLIELPLNKKEDIKTHG